MNVPRDYQSLFDNIVNNVNVLIQWAPNDNSAMQLSYALSGLKAGFQRAKEGFASLKVEPPQGANDLNSQEVPFKSPKAYSDYPEDELIKTAAEMLGYRAAKEWVEVPMEPKLDFTGKWKTRGGISVEVTGWTGTEWAGHFVNNVGEVVVFHWNEDGKCTTTETYDLMEGFREGAGFANA